MPTTLTPPPDFKPFAGDDPREHDGGGGKRPPVDKRTGGGGDGDNWDKQPQGRRGPRERLRSARIGMFAALGAIYLFFIATITAFLVTKTSYHVDSYGRTIVDWVPVAVPSFLWINTAILLVSSVTAELARRSMFHENDALEEWIGLGRPMSRRAAFWMSATLVFGSLFIGGQILAWMRLKSAHIYLGNSQSAHYFYLFTMLHAGHLLIGIGVMVTALAMLLKGRSLQTRQVWTDCTVWYWHGMGVLWIMLFALLEFGQ